MARALPYAIGYLLPVVVAFAVRAGRLWTFAPLAVVFVVLPIVDALSGVQHASSNENAAALEGNRWFGAVTWVWVPVQALFLWWALDLTASGTLDAVERIGLAVSVGVCTGTVGMTFAHELVHRSSRAERALGELLLTMASYPHFAIEHVYGHHRHVATPRDPATARFGEGFYRFFPRTVGSGLASALRFERERVRRRYGRAWHPANRFFRYAAAQLLLYGGIAEVFGSAAVVVFALQAAVAIIEVEAINYIEHYGLERRETAPSAYERIQPWHSWDAHYRVSNWLLINLARHSDHHCLASRRYPALAAEPSTPQLPAGYGTMFVLALAPPLWRRVMDPRVRAWRARYLDSSAAPTADQR